MRNKFAPLSLRYIIIAAIIMIAIIIYSNKKMEIIHLDCLTEADANIITAYFIVSNPPLDRERLLSVLSNHLQSFMLSDTTERQIYSNHFYFKKTQCYDSYRFSCYKEWGFDYIINSISIAAQPSNNKKEITTYEHYFEREKITLPWRTE